MKKPYLVLIVMMQFLTRLFSIAASPNQEPSELQLTSEELVAYDNNIFAIDLYKKLSPQDGNLFYSPFNISTALAMTYVGARGETADEISKTLHFQKDQSSFHSLFGKLIQNLDAGEKSRPYELNMAAALWTQKNEPLLQEYLSLIKNAYNGDPHPVDFAKEAEARKTINDWVEQKTKEKIKDLIPEGVLNHMTRLVLTSAIYFKGKWLIPFEKEKTKEEEFHLTNNSTIKVPMMNLANKKFRYAEEEDFQAVELPYIGWDLSMVILLPKEKDGLFALEKKLDAKVLTHSLKTMNKREVVLTLPKFKMNTDYSLAEPLLQLGMKQAFTQSADFSGINGKKDLFISAILHKAFVEVNEEGTEAAAATAVVETQMWLNSPKPPITFKADHPFIFLIRNTHSGSILFMGRVTNP
jgi:serpin B